MKKTRTQLKATAYHEAGHAVIGRVLTLRATIKPDRASSPECLSGNADRRPCGRPSPRGT